MDFLTEMWSWLRDFLAGLGLANFPAVPAGVPIVLLIAAAILSAFIAYVVFKGALVAVLALLALCAVWILLSPLYDIVLFSSGGLAFTAMDLVLLALIAAGLYFLTKSKGK